MWTYLILAWLGMNLVLVLLLWHRAQRLDRGEAARIQPSDPEKAGGPQPRLAPATGSRPLRSGAPSASWPMAGTPPRVIVVHGEHTPIDGEPQPPALRDCRNSSGTGAPDGCRLREMQAEIRELRLAVAELSLDKARLSSAMARMRC